jgi:hypothetical protein
MGLFTKKDHVILEEIVPLIVMTAFEYPFEENIQRVQANNPVLDKEQIDKAKEQLPYFIIAINFALLKFAAEQGKIARFKNDDPYEVDKSLGYAFAIEIGRYLQNQGADKTKASSESERIGLEALSYIDAASSRLSDNPLIKDVFFEICSEYDTRVMGKFNKDNIEKSAIIFDFAKQLYRNIDESNKKIIID